MPDKVGTVPAAVGTPVLSPVLSRPVLLALRRVSCLSEDSRLLSNNERNGSFGLSVVEIQVVQIRIRCQSQKKVRHLSMDGVGSRIRC